MPCESPEPHFRSRARRYVLGLLSIISHGTYSTQLAIACPLLFIVLKPSGSKISSFSTSTQSSESSRNNSPSSGPLALSISGMTCFFFDQPIELIDHICSFMDSPRDLLSLSLVSKRVFEAVIPYHIECRHIRCDLRQVGLWKKLVSLPSIASRFVSLEITGTYKTRTLILPKHHSLLASSYDLTYRSKDKIETELWTESDCLNALAAAIQVMAGLKSFCWNVAIKPVDSLFTALKRCSSLDDVQVLYIPEVATVPGIGYRVWIHHSPVSTFRPSSNRSTQLDTGNSSGNCQTCANSRLLSTTVAS